MTLLGVAFLFGVILCGLALRANARFRDERWLPMQWWLTGDVTWSAPRAVALAIIPALAIGVLAVYVILAMSVKPRVRQEDMVFPTLIGVGAMFIALQLLHFWLIEKTLRRRGH